MPSASTAASAIGNCASSSGGIPAEDFVPGKEVVAEQFDHPVRGATDVGRALFAQEEEELVAQARHARQRDPVATEDGRPRGEVGAEQLVGRVDQVELHGSGHRRAGSGGRGTRLDELLEPDEVGLEDRPEGRCHGQGTEVGRNGGTRSSSQRTIVVVRSAPNSRVNVPLPLNVPSWLMA